MTVLDVANSVPAGERAPTSRRGRVRILPVSLLRGAAGLGALGAVWYGAGLAGALDSQVVPTLPKTISDLGQLLNLTGFWITLGYTLQSTFLGLALAVVIGLPLAVLLSERPWLRRALLPSVEAFRPVPPIVLLPIVLLLVGSGISFPLILVLQGTLWAFLIQTAYGIEAIDPVLTETARSFRIDRWRTLLLVKLPAAAPMIVSGLRLAASTAFGVSVMTELVGGVRGLGSIIAVAQSGNDVARVYSISICTGLVGLLIAWLFGWLQRRVAAWNGADAG